MPKEQQGAVGEIEVAADHIGTVTWKLPEAIGRELLKRTPVEREAFSVPAGQMLERFCWLQVNLMYSPVEITEAVGQVLIDSMKKCEELLMTLRSGDPRTRSIDSSA